jgi:hypothetical protein
MTSESVAAQQLADDRADDRQRGRHSCLRTPAASRTGTAPAGTPASAGAERSCVVDELGRRRGKAVQRGQHDREEAEQEHHHDLRPLSKPIHITNSVLNASSALRSARPATAEHLPEDPRRQRHLISSLIAIDST